MCHAYVELHKQCNIAILGVYSPYIGRKVTKIQPIFRADICSRLIMIADILSVLTFTDTDEGYF